MRIRGETLGIPLIAGTLSGGRLGSLQILQGGTASTFVQEVSALRLRLEHYVGYPMRSWVGWEALSRPKPCVFVLEAGIDK